MTNLPSKVAEDSPIPHVRTLQRALNQAIEAMRSREIRESPSTRIERKPGGVFIHAQGSGTTTTETSTARWL